MDSLPLDELVEMPQETPEPSPHMSSLSSPGLPLPNASEPAEEAGYSELNHSQQTEAGRPENAAKESGRPLMTSAPLTTEDEEAMLCFLSRDEERKEKEKKILRSGKGMIILFH